MSSVREIEAEIEATRARLSDTIERIQDKLTVSGMVDEVMGAAGMPRMQNGHDFVLGLVRRHPVPVMLAAAMIGYAVYRANRRAERSNLPVVVADAEYVDVPVVNRGQARLYDPDAPGRRPPDRPERLTADSGEI